MSSYRSLILTTTCWKYYFFFLSSELWCSRHSWAGFIYVPTALPHFVFLVYTKTFSWIWDFCGLAWTLCWDNLQPCVHFQTHQHANTCTIYHFLFPSSVGSRKSGALCLIACIFLTHVFHPPSSFVMFPFSSTKLLRPLLPSSSFPFSFHALFFTPLAFKE